MKSPEWSRSERNQRAAMSRASAVAPPLSMPASGAESVPPRLPDGEERVRAIMLLGSRKKMELGTKVRAELETLVGCYPSVKQAGVWKQALQALRR